jgi:hypothetical protein
LIFGAGGNGGGGPQTVSTLHGDAGNDTFVFGQQAFNDIGLNAIDDFHVGSPSSPWAEMDRIMLLNSAPVTEFDDLAPFISQDGLDTLITFDANNVIRLTGVDHTTLQTSNFVIHPGSIT